MNRNIILALALAAGAAHAEFKDGNKLLSQIQSSGAEYGIALGYVTGVADATVGIYHCPPPNITAGQVTDMVKLHLEQHPDKRHLSADTHVVYVLKSAWPCPKKSSNGGTAL